MSIIGGTLTDKTDCIVAPQGWSNQAVPHQFEEDLFMKEFEIRTPKWTSLKECGNKEEMKKVIMEAQGGDLIRNVMSMKCWKIVAIPPFIARAIIMAKSFDPLEVILTILKVISEQDIEKEEDEDSADENCRDCFTLCVGIYLKEIDTPISTVASEKPQVKR